MEAPRAVFSERHPVAARECECRQRPQIHSRQAHAAEVRHARAAGRDASQLPVFFIEEQERVDVGRHAADRGVELRSHRAGGGG